MNQQQIKKQIALEMKLDYQQVKNTVQLLDSGNTIPFIARYRKEATDNLDEVQLRDLEEKLNYLRNLAQRKEEIIELITKQGKMKVELKAKIQKATQLQQLEDLYRPYKTKRKTRATKAREQGLGPLAKKFMAQKLEEGSITEEVESYLGSSSDLESTADVLQGVRDIIAEEVAVCPEVRALARELSLARANLKAEVIAEQDGNYQDYYDYSEAIKKIPPHRILAINRGEQEKVLRVKVVAPSESIIAKIKNLIIENQSTIFLNQLEEAIEDSYKRLIAPAISRELRTKLSTEAAEHAIQIFARNLRSLLLQAPLRDEIVLGIDPGFRSGSKVAVVEETGELLQTATIYPYSSQNKKEQAQKVIKNLIEEYQVEAIAIGNGTASRETEEFVAELISTLERDLAYTIISEAGASVYSASQVAREEFPALDVSLRGAVSIARRLQDPLAELVKIEPQHIGVGMYQHDLEESDLKAALESVVESVVNYIGVDLNTASPSLLAYVAGINQQVAAKIVEWRREQGSFIGRAQLKEVYGIGPKTFLQAAGFLRIYNGEDKLAMTAIHPESYSLAEQILNKIGFDLKKLDFKRDRFELQQRLNNLKLDDLELEAGNYTLLDIKESLLKPNRDPREELAGPIFKKGVITLDDLSPGMILEGTVQNVIDFGAFVDIGVKVDGLVHISELSSAYVNDPLEVVTVGDQVKVKILKIDQSRKRIALTMNF